MYVISSDDLGLRGNLAADSANRNSENRKPTTTLVEMRPNGDFPEIQLMTMLATPQQPAMPLSTIDAVVAAIIDDLRNGDLVPGQRLLEADLAERHDVSRGTVREAIRRLSGEGVVQVHQFRGAWIRKLSNKDILDVLSVLEVMLGLAARQAAISIGASNADGRRSLETVLRELLKLEGSPDFYAVVRRREEFINTIVRLSGNGELDRAMPKLHLLLTRIQFPTLMPDSQRFNDYRLMGEAILAGEEGLAEYVARLHIQHASDAFAASIPASKAAPDSGSQPEALAGGRHP